MRSFAVFLRVFVLKIHIFAPEIKSCMREYTKIPLTIPEQVALLENRGLLISNKSRAERLLANISYYRLSAYMLPFKPDKHKNNEYFAKGTTWDDVYQLYVFDRKLRLLIFDAIERIEISIRAQLINRLSLKYGSHWYDDSTIFDVKKKRDKKTEILKTINVYGDIQQHIKEQFEKSKSEMFIAHYKNNYDKPLNPPSWMAIEVMYFNQLSMICESLKNKNDRTGISYFYDLPDVVFCSWLHSINYVRNLCAHHSRLWNRSMSIVPAKLGFSKKLKWITNPETVQRSKLYYIMCIIEYFLQTVNPTSGFKKRLYDLLGEYSDLDCGYMGFPKGWETERLWEI